MAKHHPSAAPAAVKLTGANPHTYRVDHRTEGMPVPPRQDPEIPPLVTAAEAARLLKCSRTWLSRLIDDGHLASITAGRTRLLLAAQVNRLARRRAAGFGGWRTRRPRHPIPELLSTGDAAERADLSAVWLTHLHRTGELAGAVVGGHLFVRPEELARLTEARARAGNAGDEG